MAQTTGDIVQAKRKPPVLVPLSSPLTQKPERLRQRIALIVNYAERYRELDDIEARELLNLKHILEHGVEKPKGQWFPGMSARKPKAEPHEIRKALAALL